MISRWVVFRIGHITALKCNTLLTTWLLNLPLRLLLIPFLLKFFFQLFHKCLIPFIPLRLNLLLRF